ncbi:hypothetical protein ACE01N_13510 [Saccharicrinis sp. FJH2]|uniref:hypothetical protein n=1 Tax=Saccharicrinis sp. FJH65 TaxID=3344659 RepID=UPI0035F3F6E8
MTDRFLKAKHWQIFLLTFGIPFLVQMVVMINVMSEVFSNPQAPPADIVEHLRFMPIVMFVFTAIFYGWIWSVATGLQSKLPAGVTMKVNRFKVFFFIPMVYLLLIILAISIFLGDLATMETEPDPAKILTLVLTLLPFHFFAIFCLLYIQYFAAKTIKTIEYQREVSFGDFIGEFFLIWFYPIGIWFLQPKINTFVTNNASSDVLTPEI